MLLDNSPKPIPWTLPWDAMVLPWVPYGLTMGTPGHFTVYTCQALFQFREETELRLPLYSGRRNRFPPKMLIFYTLKCMLANIVFGLKHDTEHLALNSAEHKLS